MEKELFLEAIKIIVARCSIEVIQQALAAKRLYENNSPMASARYSHLLEAVFADGVQFTPEEKQVLAKGLSLDEDGKSVVLNVRMSQIEKTKLAVEAESRGITLSEYARRKLLD